MNIFFYSYYLNSIRKNYIANLSLCKIKKKELMIKSYFNYKIIIKIKIIYNVIHKILTL